MLSSNKINIQIIFVQILENYVILSTCIYRGNLIKYFNSITKKNYVWKDYSFFSKVSTLVSKDMQTPGLCSIR